MSDIPRRVVKRRKDGVVQHYHVGSGHAGDVYDVGRGKVLKVFPGRVQKVPGVELNNEFSRYVKLKLYRFPVIVPMTWTKKGILMPKLSVITRSALPKEYKEHGFLFVESLKISDYQLKTLWDGLRELSRAGIESHDVLHVGIDVRGKPHFFDIGGFSKSNVTDAELANQSYWETFTKRIGREDYKELFPENPTPKDIAIELNGIQPRKEMFIAIGHKKILVFRNPDRRDYALLEYNFKQEYPHAPIAEPKTRKTYDVAGNIYVWMSGESTHYFMESGIKKQLGLTTNQQWRANRDRILAKAKAKRRRVN